MTTYYVSIDGNDSAAGTSTSTPFATLQRAVQAMGSSSSGDVTYVLDGTYSVTSPLTLNSSNSGDTIAAYDGAAPVISGGTQVSGWTAGANGIWTVHLNNVSDVQQLAVNGVSQTEARYPNYDANNPIKGGWLWAKDAPSGHDATMEMAYNPGDFHNGQPAAGEKVTVFSQLGYSSDVLTIANVDSSAGLIKFTSPASYDIGSGSRYFISGAQPLLDSPGEWWFDSNSHTLYYKAPAGFDGSNAVVSNGHDLIDIQNASNVTIKGLAFTDVPTDAPSSDFTTSAIHVQGDSSHVTLDGNSYVNVAKGVVVDDNSNHVTISNSSFTHLWSSAVDLTPETSQNTVTNNTISHTGEVFRTGGAVTITESWGNTISHNTIDNVPRFGIEETNYDPSIKSGSNIVEYNQLTHTGQQTPDVGAIYVYSHDDPGALGDTIRYNSVVDAGGLGTNGDGFMPGQFMSAGIYMDDFASNAQIYGNFVQGTWFGGVYLHGGSNNSVWGNTLVGNSEVGIQLFPIDDKPMTGTEVHGNIVTLPTHVGENVVDVDPSLVDPQDIHDNIFVGDAAQAQVGEMSLSAWKAMGGGAGTTVVTDPGFTDPGAGDYSLKDGSYALSHGYTQLPWSDMGSTQTVLPQTPTSPVPDPVSDPTPTPDPVSDSAPTTPPDPVSDSAPTPTPDPISDPAPSPDTHLISGTGGNDILIGTAGNDTINGGPGTDFIHGNGGSDVLTGGSGLDRFYFDTPLDGNNNVSHITDFTPMSDEFFLNHSVFSALPAGELQADVFHVGATAQSSTNHIIYDSGSGHLFYDADGSGSEPQLLFATVSPKLGLTSDDFHVVADSTTAPDPAPTADQAPTPSSPPEIHQIQGTSGNDILVGTAGDDKISGGAGTDYIHGKGGNDVLTGGGGLDRFYFDAQPDGHTNISHITDFTPMKDEIFLSKNAFSALPSGDLHAHADAFHIGAAAQTPADRIVYQSNTGHLLYDSDGSGSAPAVQFASVAPHLNLTSNDFFVV